MTALMTTRQRSLKEHSIKVKQNFNVRLMTQADLEMVLAWSAYESWNPGLHEAEAFYAADPSGWWLLEVNGEAVASLGCVKHTDDFAFMGLYIVREEYRGHGYGMDLWKIATKSIAHCRTIGGNGLIHMLDTYEEHGFTHRDHLNTRWCGSPNKDLLSKAISDNNIKLTKEFSVKTLSDYEAKIFPVSREAFYNKWLNIPESHVCVAMEGDKVRGFAVLAMSVDGYKIAPLLADNEKIAEMLFVDLSKKVINKGLIHLDTVASNPLGAKLAKRFNMESIFDTRRIYIGEVPQIDHSKIFGLTTLEIG